jgi:hypothetical protein
VIFGLCVGLTMICRADPAGKNIVAVRKAKIDAIVRIFNRSSGKWGKRSLEMADGEHAAFLTLVKYENNNPERGLSVIPPVPVEPLRPAPGYESYRG